MFSMLQAKYTIELGKITEDKNFNLFNFEYDFIDEQLKKSFEKYFIDCYYFNEIGQETIGRFQKMLQIKLNRIMPYYKQLYNTQEVAKKCDFMLNKDLKETFIRNLNNDYLENATNKGLSNSTTDNNSISINDYKESSIDNGLAEVDINSSLTNATNSKNNDNSNSISNYNNENKNNINRKNNENEETTLISQGNIGTTSSGELLEAWRKSLINIYEMIIKDCRNLFMLIY